MIDLLSYITFECAVEADNTHMYIWDDRTSRGSRAREEVLPRYIEMTEELIEFLARYIGDGKTSSKSHHIEYSSIDIDLVQKHIAELQNIFGISRISQRFYLRAPVEIDVAVYTQQLQVPESCISSYVKDRHRRVSITAQYGSKYFTKLVLGLIGWLLDSNLQEKKLQAAFLRGLFAAEGCVHQQDGNCISGLSFSLHSNEVLVQIQLENCLTSLGIGFSTRKMKNRKCKITTITGWKNYAACWMFGILDGCSRKKKAFYEQMATTDLHAEVSAFFKESVLERWKSVHELSRYMGVSYERLLYWFDNTTTLTINELVSVATASGFVCESVLGQVTSLSARVSDDIVVDGFLDSYWNSLVQEGVIP